MTRHLTAAVCLATALLAASPLTVHSDDSGPATFYSSSYGVGWWEQTLALHASWGNAVAGWDYDPNGYYCVHPAYLPGERLFLSANGISLTCTVGDTVAAGDEGEWWANGIVEVNWQAFVDLGLVDNNWVTVGWADDEPVEEPEPPAPETTRFFAETGYWVDEPFLSYWDAWGGLPIFGYPLGGAYDDAGMTVQYFERARFEWHTACHCILLGRVGAEVLGR